MKAVDISRPPAPNWHWSPGGYRQCTPSTKQTNMGRSISTSTHRT